jgi:hypothetical protein
LLDSVPFEFGLHIAFPEAFDYEQAAERFFASIILSLSAEHLKAFLGEHSPLCRTASSTFIERSTKVLAEAELLF